MSISFHTGMFYFIAIQYKKCHPFINYSIVIVRFHFRLSLGRSRSLDYELPTTRMRQTFLTWSLRSQILSRTSVPSGLRAIPSARPLHIHTRAHTHARAHTYTHTHTHTNIHNTLSQHFFCFNYHFI